MNPAIGLIEVNSIAQGMIVADKMVEEANVELILSTTICPGRYIVLVGGNVGAVESSVQAGIKVGEGFIIDELVINRVNPQLMKVINSTNRPEEKKI